MTEDEKLDDIISSKEYAKYIMRKCNIQENIIFFQWMGLSMLATALFFRW